MGAIAILPYPAIRRGTARKPLPRPVALRIRPAKVPHRPPIGAILRTIFWCTVSSGWIALEVFDGRDHSCSQWSHSTLSFVGAKFCRHCPNSNTVQGRKIMKSGQESWRSQLGRSLCVCVGVGLGGLVLCGQVLLSDRRQTKSNRNRD